MHPGRLIMEVNIVYYDISDKFYLDQNTMIKSEIAVRFVISWNFWNLENFDDSWEENDASRKVDHRNQCCFKMTFLITFISIIKLCNQIWQSILPVLVPTAKIRSFYPRKKAKKNMLRQVDICGLMICYSMTFKLSMGKNSAWYFFIPRSNLFLPVYYFRLEFLV